jgi:hypothetical protein
MPPTEAPGSARIRKDICNSTKFLAQNLFCLHTDLHPKIRRRPEYHPKHVLVLFQYETINRLGTKGHEDPDQICANAKTSNLFLVYDL